MGHLADSDKFENEDRDIKIQKEIKPHQVNKLGDIGKKNCAYKRIL
jgi:hypothetical protein